MNAKTKIEQFPRFDAAEHLKDEGDIAAYLRNPRCWRKTMPLPSPRRWAP